MNKTKIDWCDSTWNPVTGCLYGCKYCYAKSIATRFSGKAELWSHDEKIHELTEKQYLGEDEKACPYPYGFEPSFHRYRLHDYDQKEGRNIFVCSMADLFGEWVPEAWQKEIFTVCRQNRQHNYLFLTKNPRRLPRTSELYNGIFGVHLENMWFGTTITCQKDLEDRLFPLLQVKGHVFLSIEPLHGQLDLDKIWVSEKKGEVYLSLPERNVYYFGGRSAFPMPEWVIIGAETGTRRDRIIPKRCWISEIVSKCKMAGIPVFMKESLKSIWGEDLVQEYPECLQNKQN